MYVKKSISFINNLSFKGAMHLHSKSNVSERHSVFSCIITTDL